MNSNLITAVIAQFISFKEQLKERNINAGFTANREDIDFQWWDESRNLCSIVFNIEDEDITLYKAYKGVRECCNTFPINEDTFTKIQELYGLQVRGTLDRE